MRKKRVRSGRFQGMTRMQGAFIDSNILLYAISGREEEKEKALIARELLLKADSHISIQVLNEFTVNATSARKHGLSREVASRHCSVWKSVFTVHPVNGATYDLAMVWFLPSRLSLWDSMIVASANLAGCDTLFTEDLNNGEVFGNVRVVNPFPLKE